MEAPPSLVCNRCPAAGHASRRGGCQLFETTQGFTRPIVKLGLTGGWRGALRIQTTRGRKGLAAERGPAPRCDTQLDLSSVLGTSLGAPWPPADLLSVLCVCACVGGCEVNSRTEEVRDGVFGVTAVSLEQLSGPRCMW